MQTFATAVTASRIPAAVVMRGTANLPQVGGTRQTFARDEELFAEGDKAEFFYKVVSGTVRVCKILSDGRRQIESFHFSGDLFGLESAEEHRFTAEAVDDVVVEAYRRSRFSNALRDEPAFGNLLMNSMLTSLERAQEHMVLLGRKTAHEKLATFLLDMAKRLNRTDCVPLPMQRTDIADHLGLTIETVSRTLTQMVREGSIRLAAAGRTIILSDRAALEQLEA